MLLAAGAGTLAVLAAAAPASQASVGSRVGHPTARPALVVVHKTDKPAPASLTNTSAYSSRLVIRTTGTAPGHAVRPAIPAAADMMSATAVHVTTMCGGMSGV
jgi:hypothetical protein